MKASTALCQSANSIAVPGLIDSSEHDNSELFIVEGKSAANALRAVRDRRNQAILPLQGKILSPKNNSSKKLLSNQIVGGLVRSIRQDGCVELQETALRYKKLIILMDGDVDGLHARALITSFFFLHMPWVLDRGDLFAVYPPLFRLYARSLNRSFNAISVNHRNRIQRQLEIDGVVDIEITYYKGVASLQADALSEQCVNPVSRTIRQITIADCAALNR